VGWGTGLIRRWDLLDQQCRISHGRYYLKNLTALFVLILPVNRQIAIYGRCGEDNGGKNKFTRNKAKNTGQEHQADKNIAFKISHFYHLQKLKLIQCQLTGGNSRFSLKGYCRPDVSVCLRIDYSRCKIKQLMDFLRIVSDIPNNIYRCIAMQPTGIIWPERRIF
jgi:hypothetical protein